MRTTLVLDDDVYDKARRTAFEERRSLGDVVSEWARRGSGAMTPGARRRGLGQHAGQIWIADDFDDTPQELLDSIDAPIGPT